MCWSGARTIQLVLMSDWLLQLDKCMDLQLDGAVRQHFQHKPSSSSSLFFTSQSSSSRLSISSPFQSISLFSFVSPSRCFLFLPPTASTAPVCPLLCGHRLGFTSGGLQLHQAPWSRPARPCGPAEEQSAGNTEIKATFNTCWFYCLKIQHMLFQSTKHMDSSSTSCDHYTRDASVY